ncbi:MAG: hypothetical protein QF718_01895 [Phycisphaerales bacterium]|jgi:hypothetical protein|nr:hypothetical protein [Phycisphaerales bacterium]
MDTWIRSIIVLLATGFVGFFGAWQASALVSTRGVLGPTIFQSISPISSMLAVALTIGVASVVAGFVAKCTTSTTGMFILGFSLFAMAMKLEGMQELVMNNGNFNVLALEAAFISVLVLLGTLVVFALGGPLKCVSKPMEDENTAKQLGISICLSLAILPVIWFIASTPAKGQVLGASAVGGVLIGILSRQFLRSMQPIILFALPIACGGLGYLIGLLLSDTSPASFAQQKISSLLFPMPIEYAAGIIIGLALGLGWTSSHDENTVPEIDKKVAP